MPAKVAAAAGRAGPAGESQFRQALALADRYSIDSWQLHRAYLRALLLDWTGAPAAIAPLATRATEQLNYRPKARLQFRCPIIVWSGHPGQQFCLPVSKRCSKLEGRPCH